MLLTCPTPPSAGISSAQISGLLRSAGPFIPLPLIASRLSALPAVLRRPCRYGSATRIDIAADTPRRGDRPRPPREGPLNRWAVAAASVVTMAGLGSFNAWSVFRRPLSELYGANVTAVNTAFFVSSLVFGLVASGSAILVSKVGPRAVGVSGALLYGLGVFSSSFVGGSLPLLYLTYGLVAAVGLGLAVMAPIAALPSWFPERPGFAYGVAFIGFGMGPLVNVPLMEGLLSATGGPLETFYFLGIIYAAIIGGAAWFVRYPSKETGLPNNSGSNSVEKGRGAWCLRVALRTWQSYALWAVFFLNTTACLAILSEARVMASSIGGASAALAAAFIMIISVSDAAGRLLWPALSDTIGGRGVFLAMFCLQAAAFLLMPTLAVGSLEF